ncbi:MAG: thioredoxin domain-containing protein [Candidatus Diapherotrites archaeon]
MSDTIGEHHMHHPPVKGDDFHAYVLPLSILLAAIIIGWSMTTSAAALGKSFANIAINVPSNGGDNLPVLPTDQEDLAPSITKTMAELLADAPGGIGSDSAPLVMVEYSDYQCPYCKVFFKDTEGQLIDKYVESGQLQIFYKDFPLSFHSMAANSANAARCAGEQGKYWEMHDKIFEETYAISPSATSQYTIDDLKKWGADLGLNTTQFDSCVDSSKYDAEIQADLVEGQTVGVGGTPSFVIGLRDQPGQLIVGAQPYSSFEMVVESLLQQAN